MLNYQILLLGENGNLYTSTSETCFAGWEADVMMIGIPKSHFTMGVFD